MRYNYLSYFLLLWLCCWAAWAGAQTPYDSFAPELSRPILDKDSVDAWRKEQQMLREQEQLQRQQETLARLQQEPLFVAFDMQQQMCYLLDTAMQVLAYTPIPEDVQRWLSVDPLADQYIHQSPYLYCNGNPVMFIDPDGMAPSDEEAAWMAEVAYNDKSTKNTFLEKLEKNGWYLSDTYENENGLKSALFSHKTGENIDEYAYAFAGTDGFSKKDWLANVAQVKGTSSQYKMAVAIAISLSNFYGDTELTFVGHSLGGGEATAASMATGRAAITFNPAALSRATIANLNLNCVSPNVTNFITIRQTKLGLPYGGDPLNIIQASIPAPYPLIVMPGRTFPVQVKGWNAHSLSNFY